MAAALSLAASELVARSQLAPRIRPRLLQYEWTDRIRWIVRWACEPAWRVPGRQEEVRPTGTSPPQGWSLFRLESCAEELLSAALANR